jgi:hypothetical protein
MGVVFNLGKNTASLMNTCTSDFVKIHSYQGLEPSVRLHNLSEHPLASNSKVYSMVLNYYQMINFLTKEKHTRPCKDVLIITHVVLERKFQKSQLICFINRFTSEAFICYFQKSPVKF